jgi:chromosomal replication initiator protein
MSTPHGCNGDREVVDTFTEALKRRVGTDRFRIWFSGVRFAVESGGGDGKPGAGALVAVAGGQFAADRLTKHFLSEMRAAAAAAFGRNTAVKVLVETAQPQQASLPFDDGSDPAIAAVPATTSSADRSTARTAAKRQQRRSSAGPQSLRTILHDGTDSRRGTPRGEQAIRTAERDSSGGETVDRKACAAATPTQASSRSGNRPAGHAVAGKPQPARDEYRWENFVAGDCNELARAACRMAIETPSTASPLVLWGPAGCGKTHLLAAVANKLRGIHRMRRLVSLSAEEFTNDFIKALNTSSLPSFRLRFRDADALLIDDVQFFVEKKATIRELHHTIEMLAESGKPLLFAGTRMPSEIKGLDGQLSGRLAAGLVCQLDALDTATRYELLSLYAQQRCQFPWPEETLRAIAESAAGDGRVLSGIVNLVNLLQRMERQMPSLDRIRQHGAHLLRSGNTPITLSSITRAVEKVFGLDARSLQSNSQTKSVTEPRMLAMYLSREMTSSAFSEIGGHFGGRSHSTAILANQRVRQWLDAGRAIGRGKSALPADEAIRRIEALLKTG